MKKLQRYFQKSSLVYVDKFIYSIFLWCTSFRYNVRLCFLDKRLDFCFVSFLSRDKRINIYIEEVSRSLFFALTLFLPHKKTKRRLIGLSFSITFFKSRYHQSRVFICEY